MYLKVNKIQLMEDQNNPQGLQRINFWFKTSVTFKLFTICFLALILLIPASMITNIINEREHLSEQTRDEVSNNVASSQELTGPILSIPIISPPMKIRPHRLKNVDLPGFPNL